MAFVDSDGYIKRKTKSGRRNPTGKGTVRDWYLVKSKGYSGAININCVGINTPKEYIGKRVKLKVEVLK